MENSYIITRYFKFLIHKEEEIMGSARLAAYYFHQHFAQEASHWPIMCLFYPEADLLARHSKNTNVPLCLE